MFTSIEGVKLSEINNKQGKQMQQNVKTVLPIWSQWLALRYRKCLQSSLTGLSLPLQILLGLL